VTATSHATLDATAVAALADEPLDWRFKGLPFAWSGSTPARLRGADPFGDGAPGPLCTLDAAALDHNTRVMAQWCAARDVELAPHGKTHMAPQLFARQAAAGATAVTVATTSQARVYRAFGAAPVIIANEVVDEPGLRWLAGELAADPGFDVTCWVDSVRGVELMAAALAGTSRPLDVCVEVGMPDGRTGCRTDADADAVVRAVSASDRLRLVGVAGYEAATSGDVRGYLDWMRATTLRLRGAFDTERVIVTAGGSSYFDVVAETLTNWPAGLSVRTVLRSGCYLTHDDGLYARSSPLRDTLRPALSVWARVVSRPEPDLALVAMGRRDVSFDADMPIPRGLGVCERLNDQHAYVRLDRGVASEVGDWVAFGVSHPCTTFDKWPLIPLLDDGGRVIELVRTFF
jgi:D-serine deaminase-like pyridoxal phosphate-dependent protein